MAIIFGFLGSMIFVLVVGFGWVYLCRKLLRLLEIKSQPRGLPQYAFAQAQQAKSRTAFKLLIIGGSFLIVGGIVSFFLRSYPTYLVVSWVILIIFVSNILNQELRLYYRIGLEQALTNLQMKAVKIARHSSPLRSLQLVSRRNPHNTEQVPDLRTFTDTTAYLQALRQAFRPGGKRRDDQHR
jgi:hypothetical protein